MLIACWLALCPPLEGFSESLAKELDLAWNIKVLIVEPGAFKTSVLEKDMIVAPPHPAYTNPTLPGSHIGIAFLAGAGHQQQSQEDNEEDKEGSTQTRLTINHASKAVAKINEMADLASPPLHFPLGEDVLTAAREKIRSLSEETEAYASWSENLA
ncbi:hypothetical protein GY45DRAFT_202872 [Cubamyces sp. BRFM 1775]|nr:hypothetical protein GY45DRAFT_202872 [Cubamyces sp. BRFM 1775]